MFRTLGLRLSRPLVLTSIKTHPIRTFSTTPILLKKKPKKGAATSSSNIVEEAVEEGPLIDFDDVTSKFNQVIEKFSKIASESKLGKTNPRIFDKLNVTVEDEEVPFTTVAQTSVKGRNFIITLFDPANSKHVINTVLGSGLNMNAQVDPSNKYTLKVPLPPINTETKKENVKHLKEVYEKFKTGSSKGSLASIRSDVKHKFSKSVKKQKSDAEQKVLDDFEKLHKKYSDKLTEVFKTAETAILK